MRREELYAALNREQRIMVMLTVTNMSAIAERVGLNMTDFQCTNALQLLGPMTPGELADITGITRGGAITSAIDRLEKGGWVARRRDEQDRRKVLVELNLTRALEHIGPMFGGLQRRLGPLLEEFTEEQVRFLVDYTARVNQASRETIAELRATVPARPRRTPPSG